MKVKVLFVCTFLLFSCYGFSQQAGDLDLSFGISGKVKTDLGTPEDVGISLAIQEDNKIVVVGYTRDSIGYHPVILRYNSEGLIDSTFAIDGKIVPDFDGKFLSVVIENGGKILVAGVTNNTETGEDFVLARYLANGMKDVFFGNQGVVFTDFGGHEYPKSIITQPDGKILVAGNTSVLDYSDFALARYNYQGKLDSSFGQNGLFVSSVGNAEDVCNSMAIQNDGKIVLGGFTNLDTNGTAFALIRVNQDGSIDSDFGINGKVTTLMEFYFDETPRSYGTNVLIQQDQKIVLTGFAFNWVYHVAIARYENNGQLDESFGYNEGYSFEGPSTIQQFSTSSILQPDGKILLAGYLNITYENTDFFLIRYNSDGMRDYTFGTNGYISTVMGGWTDQANSIALQSDSKIVLAGYSSMNSSVALTRYYNDINLRVEDFEKSDIPVIVYPNPATNVISLKFNSKHQFNNSEIRIYNSTNQLIVQSPLHDSISTIDVSSYSSGIYFFCLTSNGRDSWTKFVKE